MDQRDLDLSLADDKECVAWRIGKDDHLPFVETPGKRKIGKGLDFLVP